MKKFAWLVLGIVVLVVRSSSGQQLSSPRIEWQRSYGGALNDLLYSIAQTTNGFLLGGRSTSAPGGSKTSPHFGNYDYWVVRTDAQGQPVWDRTFGGSQWDELFSVQVASGGFFLSGSSDSDANGNKTSPPHGYRDGWVIKIDDSGAKVWEQSFGGTQSDVIWTTSLTRDGGLIAGGYSDSPVSGNKSSPLWGGEDFWIIRLAPNGAKLWDRSFGGPSADRLYGIVQTSDGGYLLGGSSSSSTNEMKRAGGFGSLDFWIVRLDADGMKLWDCCYGGSSSDELCGLLQTSDGGFLLGGYSLSSPSGNKTASAFGQYDLWVVRIDAQGNKLWDQSFGGYGNEGFLNTFGLALTPDGGFIFGSGTQGYSVAGNKVAPDLGGGDWWVVRLGPDGSKIWDQAYGTPFFESLYSLQRTRDGGYLMGGSCYGDIGGNKTVPSNGGSDFWLVKLAAEVPHLGLLTPQDPQAPLHLTLTGESNRLYVTEFSDNLRDWVALRTNRLSGSSLEIILPSAPVGTHRFYRERVAE